MRKIFFILIVIIVLIGISSNILTLEVRSGIQTDTEYELDNSPRTLETATGNLEILEGSISVNDMQLKVNEKKALDIQHLSKELDVEKITYHSNDISRVNISADGVVSAISEGITSIDIYYDNIYVESCTVEVGENIASRILKLDVGDPEINIIINHSRQIELITELSKKEQNKLKFKSSNSDIVTVDEYGIIIAKSKGIAKITVSLDNYAEDYCKVIVKDSYKADAINDEYSEAIVEEEVKKFKIFCFTCIGLVILVVGLIAAKVIINVLKDE